jgi:hypothetical protein
MIEARASNAAILLPEGTVLVASGRGNSDVGYGLLATAELYDPVTGPWNRYRGWPRLETAIPRRGCPTTR